MNLLILGGTQFVGRHITAEALARAHRVTLFNRGMTNADLFPDAERLYGNRDGGLEPLRGRSWDAVIDVNGYLPRLVAASAHLLADHVARYVYISTLSVYADFAGSGQDEDAPLATLQDPAIEDITGETYGALKALCEQAVKEAFPGRGAILRLGYVVGPYDHTDRLTSWLRRAARGGEMLVPAGLDAPVQFIDARDVAAFALDLVERQATGVYNVTGPAQALTWRGLLEQAKAVSGADTRFIPADNGFMEEHGVDEGELPMYPPEGAHGLMAFDNRRALAAGLTFRPLADTIRDTLAWDRAEGTPRAGLTPERETQLLRLWHKP